MKAYDEIEFWTKKVAKLETELQLQSKRASILEDALAQAIDQFDEDYVHTPLDGHAALIRKLRAALIRSFN